MSKYRHEYKYIVSDLQREVLMRKAHALMTMDPHVGPTGRYQIRSLYFDDVYNRCYYENENGTDPREKFRIRIYQASSEIIKLENKRKEMSMTYKCSCRMTKTLVDELIQGNTPSVDAVKSDVFAQLIYEMRTHCLHPVVIVEYDRVPFIYPLGNVRVTFDSNIRSSSQCKDFFNEYIDARPILPRGYSLMEVKFDEFLPDFVLRGLQLEELQQTAFSKYYLCRKFLDR